jgi:hypothetical protein
VNLITKNKNKIMENTLVAGITYTFNKEEVVDEINKTIDSIEKWIEENNYQVTGNMNLYRNLDCRNLSKNQMKQIQKYCFWISRKISLKRVNSFFSLLSRYFGIERIHVRVSVKEEAIQKARKAWLKAREESDRLMKVYKDEKGEFYKNKL